MADDKQLFAPVPLRAMALDLSGLQLRVLICVAAHDRMSLPTGKGQGCRASNLRMQGMIGCNFSRLCSTLTQLVDAGLLERDRLGRHTIYRVVYTDDDRLLFSNASAGTRQNPLTSQPDGQVNEIDESGAAIGCQEASDDPSIGCRDIPDFASFPPETLSQYIPLNGVRDSVETGENNSSEDARLATRLLVDDLSRSLKGKGKDSRQKAGRSRMPHSENVGGQMARLERALDAGEPLDGFAWYEWLAENGSCHEDTNLVGRAMRLADKLLDAMHPDDYARWNETYGPASFGAVAA